MPDATATAETTASTSSTSALATMASSASGTTDAAATTQATATTASTAQRPEYIPEKFWSAEKGEPDVMKLGAAYLGLEKKLGTRVEIAPPTADSTPEQITAWRKLNGVPEKPEDYGLKAPDNLPEGVQWNEKLGADFAKLAHELHLPPQVVQKLAEFHNGNLGAMVKQAQETQAANREATINTLKTEWGAEFPTKANEAAMAAKAFGVDIEKSEVADHPDFIRAMANAAKLLKEDQKMPSNSNATLGESIQAKMDAIRSSPDYQGTNGPEKQMAAQARLKHLFDSQQK